MTAECPSDGALAQGIPEVLPVTAGDVVQEVGNSCSAGVRQVMRSEEVSVKKKRTGRRSSGKQINPDPTPQNIRRACQEIQATWSRRERARRAGYPSPEDRPSVIPTVRLGDVVEAIIEMEGEQ